MLAVWLEDRNEDRSGDDKEQKLPRVLGPFAEVVNDFDGLGEIRMTADGRRIAWYNESYPGWTMQDVSESRNRPDCADLTYYDVARIVPA